MKKNSRKDSSDCRAPISTSSIFILSSFLFGVSASSIMGDEFTPFLLSGGLVGIISYFVFEMTKHRHRNLELEQNREFTRKSVQNRLEKHLHRQSHTEQAEENSREVASHPIDIIFWKGFQSLEEDRTEQRNGIQKDS